MNMGGWMGLWVKSPRGGHFLFGSPVLNIDNTSLRTLERDPWAITLENSDFRISWLGFVSPVQLGSVPPLVSTCLQFSSGGHFLGPGLPRILKVIVGPVSHDVSDWLLLCTPGIGTPHTCLTLNLSICSNSCVTLGFANHSRLQMWPGFCHLCWTWYIGPLPHDFVELWGSFLLESFGSALSLLFTPSGIHLFRRMTLEEFNFDWFVFESWNNSRKCWSSKSGLRGRHLEMIKQVIWIASVLLLRGKFDLRRLIVGIF